MNLPKIQLIKENENWLKNTGFQNPFKPVPEIYRNQRVHRPVCGCSCLESFDIKIPYTLQHYFHSEKVFKTERHTVTGKYFDYGRFKYIRFTLKGISFLVEGDRDKYLTITRRKEGNYPDYYASLEKGTISFRKVIAKETRERFHEKLEELEQSIVDIQSDDPNFDDLEEEYFQFPSEVFDKLPTSLLITIKEQELFGSMPAKLQTL